MTLSHDAQRIAKSPYLFAKKLLKIQDKEDNIIPFVMNALQVRYLQSRTARDLILKPRQVGFSTAIQAEIFRYSTTRSTRSITLTDDHQNTQKLRRMQDKFYNYLPDGFKPDRSISNAQLTVYPDFNSEIMIGTAGNTNVGRAGSYRVQHYSEIAFYKDAESILKSALQGGKPFWVVAESTANGAQGLFYELCMNALRNEGIWKLHFFTWFDYSEYQLPLTDAEPMRYTDEEKDLIHLHHLTPEQINWRRFKIAEIGEDGFMQEYPEDPETCFLTSGRGVFQLNKADLFTSGHDDLALIGFPVYVQDGYEANEESVHVMAIDWGQSPDSTAVSIWDSNTHQEIALFVTGKRDYEHIISDITTLARIYEVQYIIPERNSMSLQISQLASALTEAMPDTMPKISPFNMNLSRKDSLVKLFQQGIISGIRLLDHMVAKHELRIFQTHQNPSTGSWSYSAPPGEHDDTVIARLLGHLACYQLRDSL